MNQFLFQFSDISASDTSCDVSVTSQQPTGTFFFFYLNFMTVDLKMFPFKISFSNSLISSTQAERNRPEQKQSPSASQNTHRKNRNEDLHIQLSQPDREKGQIFFLNPIIEKYI